MNLLNAITLPGTIYSIFAYMQLVQQKFRNIDTGIYDTDTVRHILSIFHLLGYIKCIQVVLLFCRGHTVRNILSILIRPSSEYCLLYVNSF